MYNYVHYYFYTHFSNLYSIFFLYLKKFDKIYKNIYNLLSKQKTEYIGGVTMKRTYQPNNHRKSKKMGFMARMKTKIINSRRKKGRKVLSH